jgi:ferrochelatase
VKTGYLILNLGTPESTSVSDVRRYLKEFLSDPYVIDIPAPLRWFLLNVIILPRRPAKSAEAYKAIWTQRGSPLLFHSLDLLAQVRSLLPGIPVELAMRYGRPSADVAIRNLKESGCQRVVCLPLYPQYSLAATVTGIEWVRERSQVLAPNLEWKFINDFCLDEGFLDSFKNRIQLETQDFKPDFTLFSFHGIPERHVQKTDHTGTHCLAQQSCCDTWGSHNRLCYRAQSYATARALARQSNLENSKWSVSFQSRLGRTPWIRPYTDQVLKDLAGQGVRRLLVVCPAFVADCLETLEEIAIRERESFIAAGGEDLRLVPSLNSGSDWAQAVVNMLSRESTSRASEVPAG